MNFCKLLDLIPYNVGTRHSLRGIRKDYKALGAAVNYSGVQVTFSSLLPVKGKGFERAIQSATSKKWLQDRYKSQGFSSFFTQRMGGHWNRLDQVLLNIFISNIKSLLIKLAANTKFNTVKMKTGNKRYRTM